MSAGPIVVDTGVLLAAADADDSWHGPAAELVEARPPDQLVLPTPVAVEAGLAHRLHGSGRLSRPPSSPPSPAATSP